MSAVAEWLVTRPWLPGNAQHAVNVQTLSSLVAIMEALAAVAQSLERIETALDTKGAERLGSAP